MKAEPQPPIQVAPGTHYPIDVTIWGGPPGPPGPPGPGGGGDCGPCAAIVSEVAPPPQLREGVLWVQPSRSVGGGAVEFTTDNPITVADPLVTTQSNGQPIGLSPDGTQLHRPTIIGAVPIIIEGRRYLIPVIEE